MSRKTGEKISVIVEVSNGRVWWVIADADDKPVDVTVLNHDEGMIRDLPVDYRQSGYIKDLTKIAKSMRHNGLLEEFEGKMKKLNPEFHNRMMAIRKKEKKK